MSLIKTIAAAFSMFSIIPMPQSDFDDRNNKYMLAVFPVVGAVQGVLLWGMYALCTRLSIHHILRCALLFATPIIYTGGIHLDGFMDTFDALAARQDKEKSLKIMSDPHIGAFAVIALAVYCILGFSLWCSMDVFDPVYFILISMLSRSLAGYAMLTFTPAKNSGLASFFSKAGSRSASGAIAVLITIFIGIALFMKGVRGMMILAAALTMLLIYYLTAKKRFGGITGDLSGWFLSVSELLMLAIYVLTENLSG
ncbi:MAG: adenosylcobinamide-GDP ribazoletransferase [Lachnospiraceae bacterium]|nr:adenosylcobinamide-GDP ribazoletransferase [Lachnospiraceae bacterium]